MSKEFRERIVKGYLLDPSQIKVILILYREALYDNIDTAKLPFILGKAITKEILETGNQIATTEEVTFSTIEAFGNKVAKDSIIAIARKKVYYFNKAIISRLIIKEFLLYKQLIYYINKATKVRRLYIFKLIVKEILNITYIVKEYIEFIYYYKRVASLQYI